jgi:hypothetical protein
MPLVDMDTTPFLHELRLQALNGLRYPGALLPQLLIVLAVVVLLQKVLLVYRSLSDE